MRTHRKQTRLCPRERVCVSTSECTEPKKCIRVPLAGRETCIACQARTSQRLHNTAYLASRTWFQHTGSTILTESKNVKRNRSRWRSSNKNQIPRLGFQKPNSRTTPTHPFVPSFSPPTSTPTVGKRNHATIVNAPRGLRRVLRCSQK